MQTGDFMVGKIVKGQGPQFLQPIDQPHAITYVPDFAAALVLAIRTPDAWGQAYHCPNCATIKLRELAAKAAQEAGQPEKKPQVVSGPLRSVLG